MYSQTPARCLMIVPPHCHLDIKHRHAKTPKILNDWDTKTQERSSSLLLSNVIFTGSKCLSQRSSCPSQYRQDSITLECAADAVSLFHIQRHCEWICSVLHFGVVSCFPDTTRLVWRCVACTKHTHIHTQTHLLPLSLFSTHSHSLNPPLHTVLTLSPLSLFSPFCSCFFSVSLFLISVM